MLDARKDALLSPVRGDAVERYPSLVVALDSWYGDLALGGSPAKTIATYRWALHPWRSLGIYTHELTEEHCRALILARMKSPRSASTTHGAATSFVKWCLDHAYMTHNPIRDVPRPRIPPSTPRYLSKQQTRAIWLAAGNDEMRLTLELLGMGMRAHEVVGLCWEHVDLARGELRLRVTKGSKPRALPLSAVALALLAGRVHGDVRVLPISTQALRARLRKLGAAAGVPHVHPHLFRHTFGTWWMFETGDAASLQTLGGWSDQAMVRHYAAAALEESAIRKARSVDLNRTLFDA